MVPAHRPVASRRACSPSGIRFGFLEQPSTKKRPAVKSKACRGRGELGRPGHPSLSQEREPGWFPLIGRSLRDGPAHPPVYGSDFLTSLPLTRPGAKGTRVAAEMNSAALDTQA